MSNSGGFTATTGASSDVSVHTGATSTIHGTFSSDNGSSSGSGSSDVNLAMTIIGVIWVLLVLVGLAAHFVRVRGSSKLNEEQKSTSLKSALIGIIVFPLELVPMYYASQA